MECTHCGERSPPSFNNCCHCGTPLPEPDKGLIDGLVDMNPKNFGPQLGGGATSSFGGGSMSHRGVNPVGGLAFVGGVILMSLLGSAFGGCGIEISILDIFTNRN